MVKMLHSRERLLLGLIVFQTAFVLAFGSYAASSTNFFRIHQTDKKYWFMSPSNEIFYALGVSHVRFDGHHCEKLGYSPYEEYCKKRYGDRQKWTQATAERLRSWGFNTIGELSEITLRDQGFAFVAFFPFGYSFALRDGLPTPSQMTYVAFPNVFSTEWATHCNAEAKRLCEPLKSESLLLGYYLDNELPWMGTEGREWGLFNEAWRKPSRDPAKKAWLSYVTERVPTTDDWKEGWGITLSSLDELPEHTNPVPPKTDWAIDITREWLKLTAERYFETVVTSIREFDSNHLILGARFVSDVPDSVLKVAGRYCDVVSINFYPHIEPGSVFSERELALLTHWHDVSQKPLIISEWSFPALDSGLPCLYGAGMRVETQNQRAACAASMQRSLASLPFIIGSVFFNWVDDPALGISSFHLENANYGLVDEEDRPYSVLVDHLTEANHSAKQLHESGVHVSGIPLRQLPVSLADNIRFGHIATSDYQLESGAMKLRFQKHAPSIELLFINQPIAVIRPRMVQISTGYAWPQATQLLVKREMQNDFLYGVEVQLANLDQRAFPNEAQFESTWKFFTPKTPENWIAVQLCQVTNKDSYSWRLLEAEILVETSGKDTKCNPRTLGFGSLWTPFYRPGGFLWVPSAGIGLGLTCANFADFDFFFSEQKDSAQGIIRLPINSLLLPEQVYSKDSPIAILFLQEHNSPAAFARKVERIVSNISGSF